jgi:MbtH protein
LTDDDIADADDRKFRVVVNDEEQYSLWSNDLGLPEGWLEIGFSATREECLRHIEAVWTDVRPASLRRWLQDRSDA